MKQRSKRPRVPSSGSGWQRSKRILIGRPLATQQLGRTLLPKRLALPIFSADALSSVAYAGEAALVVLVVASISAASLLSPLSLVIGVVLVIVVSSYAQTVRAYPSGGGAYTVARENLGQFPALTAAAALLVDYSLTVAVSIAAGVVALISALPSVASFRLELALALVGMIAFANLRGVRETSLLVAAPTYAFVGLLFATIATGLGQCAIASCPQAITPEPIAVGPALAPIGLLVILRAFAAGAAALTGIEAIANGVGAFREPKSRNAAHTLLLLGAIAVLLFVGVSLLVQATGARPSHTVSVLSEVARATFPASSPAGLLFYLVQAATLAVLILAANTAFQGFPRLAATLAADRFAPAAFANLGDRLVYSNGVVMLALVASLLLVVTAAGITTLIHLYLLGVFTAFTLSQVGMTRHWLRVGRRAGRWRWRVGLSGLGAIATGLVAVVVVVTKFSQGAWMVVVALPVLITLMLSVHRLYARFASRLNEHRLELAPEPRSTAVLYVEELEEATVAALDYLRTARQSRFRAVHVAGAQAGSLADRWSAIAPDVQLELLPATDDIPLAVADYVRSIARRPGEVVEVVIPELFAQRSLPAAARATVPFSLRTRLLTEPDIAITDIPVLAGEPRLRQGGKVTAFVLTDDVHDAVAGALDYARSLGADETRGLYVALDDGRTDAVERAWEARFPRFALQIVEAPTRELGPPLLAAIRETTGEGLAVVVVPEIVPGSLWADLVLNGRELHVRWLLLFEPNLVVTAVPYRLEAPEASLRTSSKLRD